MNLKELTPEEKLDMVRVSAYRAGEVLTEAANPLTLVYNFQLALNKTLDLIEEMGIGKP